MPTLFVIPTMEKRNAAIKILIRAINVHGNYYEKNNHAMPDDGSCHENTERCHQKTERCHEITEPCHA